MKPDQMLTWVQDGTERLRAQLAGLSDAALDGPTALPGWNRRYLFSHLAANADALRNLVHWARTGEERRMYASAQAREEDIAAGALAPSAELRARFLARAAARTERDVTPGDLASATLLADTAADRDPAERSDTAALRTAIRERFRFGPPRRRLVSTMTGAEIGSVDDAIELICRGFAGDDQLV